MQKKYRSDNYFPIRLEEDSQKKGLYDDGFSLQV